MKTISFVIPVYNEAKRLSKTFKALQELRLPRGLKLEEVIFVNDGSTDNSELRINNSELRKNLNIKLVTYTQNRGKGYAVKQGMLASKSDYTLFFDADMSTPLTELSKFVRYMNVGVDVIIGTRKNGHSTVTIHQPLYRELLGKGFTFLTNLALQTWITDFTCGFKAFSKKAKNEIFEQATINGWAYDAELVYLAHVNDFKIQEVPVVWANDARTKVKLYKAIPQTFYDLAKIRFNHRAQILPILGRIKLSGMSS